MESYSLFAWFVNHSALVTQSKRGNVFSLYSSFWLCPLYRNETKFCCLVKCLVREVYSVFVIKKKEVMYVAALFGLWLFAIIKAASPALFGHSSQYSWYFLLILLNFLCPPKRSISSHLVEGISHMNLHWMWAVWIISCYNLRLIQKTLAPNKIVTHVKRLETTISLKESESVSST